MDRTNYEYTPFDLPNLLHKNLKGVAALDTRPKLTGAWKTLIHSVAKKKPNWTVVVEKVSASPHANILSMQVYDQGEFLGSVRINSMWQERPFHIANPKLQEAYPRNRGAMTKDPRKAFNIILKYFAKKTLAEKMQEETAKVHGDMSSKVSHVVGQAFSIRRAVIDHLTDTFLVENWALVEKEALRLADPAAADRITEFPEVMKKAQEVTTMHSYLGAAKGRIISIRDGVYCTYGPGQTDPQDYDENTLPGWYKRCVGMLKLVDVNTVLPEFGYRAGDTLFYIPEEPQ